MQVYIDLIEEYRVDNKLTEWDEPDDEVVFKIEDNYGIYIRYDCQSFIPVFIIDLATMKIFELDHGLKLLSQVLFKDGYFLGLGCYLGQGKPRFFKYDLNGKIIVENKRFT